MVVLLFLVIVAVVVGIAMLLGGLTIGIAAAWFLHLPFKDGWHAAWDNPWKLLFFTLFILPLLSRGRD